MSHTGTLAASSARTTSGTSSSLGVAGQTLALQVVVTAASGTTPSMALSVQWSNDGSTWSAADPIDSMTALTAVGSAVKAFSAKAAYARVSWAITGTTPSFTFSISGYTGG